MVDWETAKARFPKGYAKREHYAERLGNHMANVHRAPMVPWPLRFILGSIFVAAQIGLAFVVLFRGG